MGSQGALLAPTKELSPEPTYTWVKPFPSEGTVLPPSGHMEQGIPLAKAAFSSIESGDSVFYFYGVVKYRDIFGDKHETKYCFVFRPKSTPDNPTPRGFYVGGPDGYNAAT